MKYMRDPQQVRLSADEPSLVGVKQYYAVIPLRTLEDSATQAQAHAAESKDPNDLTASFMQVELQRKTDFLVWFLSSIPFHQCVVFSNRRSWAVELADVLNSQGISACHIAGDLQQTERLEALRQVLCCFFPFSISWTRSIS